MALLVASPLAAAQRGGSGRPPKPGKHHTFGPGHRPDINRKNFRKHLVPEKDVSL